MMLVETHRCPTNTPQPRARLQEKPLQIGPAPDIPFRVRRRRRPSLQRTTPQGYALRHPVPEPDPVPFGVRCVGAGEERSPSRLTTAVATRSYDRPDVVCFGICPYNRETTLDDVFETIPEPGRCRRAELMWSAYSDEHYPCNCDW